MNIYNKLASVQNELRLTKTGQNPHFRSEYFELSEILNKLRPLLSKYKLCLYQGADGGTVVTKLIDLEKEEQTIASSIAFPPGLDAQKLGAAYTYLKRYSLTGMFLIDERDTDGEDAAPAATTATNTAAPAVVPDTAKKKVSFSKKAFAKPTGATATQTPGVSDDEL